MQYHNKGICKPVNPCACRRRNSSMQRFQTATTKQLMTSTKKTTTLISSHVIRCHVVTDLVTGTPDGKPDHRTIVRPVSLTDAPIGRAVVSVVGKGPVK